MADPNLFILSKTGLQTKDVSVNKILETIRQAAGDIAGSQFSSVNYFVDVTKKDDSGYSVADEVVDSAKGAVNSVKNTIGFVDFIYDNWKLCLIGFLALVVLLKD